MPVRLLIAYSLIAIMMVLAAGGIAWLVYHSRARKLKRWYRSQQREAARLRRDVEP